MTDELALVHEADLDERHGMLSPSTMVPIDRALRGVRALQ